MSWTYPKKSYVIGDRSFYGKLLFIVLPIILQNTLTNVVSLLDNVMIGQTGTLPMSAVAIVSQMFFVYMICIFGGMSGAGIYGAQYYGRGDIEGVRNVFRVKLLIVSAITLLGMIIFGFFGRELAGLYIAADTAAADRELILNHSLSYLHIMMIGFLPFALTQCYAGTLRETGQTFIPMMASIIAMAVNFVFNALLIFGLCGFPRLGVEGAAIATVLSRFVELAIVCIWAHRGTHYMDGVYSRLSVPQEIFSGVIRKALPLFLNEFLWSLGEAALLQMYSARGIDAVAAMNINNTAAQIFNEIFLSIGIGAGILIGQELGAGKLEEAVRSAWRVIFASTFCCMISGGLLALASPYIPQIYNTEQEIRALASMLLLVSALVMPLRSVTNAAYFIIRSGGQVILTFLFDSCYSWLAVIPTAFFIGHFTSIPIVPFYLICAGMELIKCFLASYFLKKRGWVKNLVAEQ